MILLTSPEAMMENIMRVFKAHKLPMPTNESEFRKIYQESLVQEHPGCFWLRPEGLNFRDSLDQPMDEQKRKKFIDLYSVDTTPLDDLAQAQVMKNANTDRGALIKRIKSAYDYLCSASDDHGSFLNLIIEGVFVDESDVAAGGTTSDAVGVIWANPHPKYEDSDLAEFLVHEFTHNCMFLDEWIHQQYDYSIMEDRSTWALSAILDKMRPIDKVIHSLAVAAEIVLLRRQIFGEPTDPKAHPPSDFMLRSIESTVVDLHRVHKETGVLTDRTLELVDIAHHKTVMSSVAAQ